MHSPRNNLTLLKSNPRSARPAASLRYTCFVGIHQVVSSERVDRVRIRSSRRSCVLPTRVAKLETPRIVFKGRMPDRASSFAGRLFVVALKIKLKKKKTAMLRMDVKIYPLCTRPRVISKNFA